MIIIYIYELRKIPTIYVGLLYLIMRNKMGWGVKRKRYEGRKRIIAMIMAMYIGTSNALAQPVSGEKIGEAPINYSYTTDRAKTQNGIVIKM